MKISKLSVRAIIENIEQRKHFEAFTLDGSLKVKINKYVPFFCTAIHNGSQLRASVQQKIALNEYQRWYEEDPFTGSFIKSMPITVIAFDSRFEYDLNRNPDNCIYEEAWGKKVWKKKLTPQEVKVSKQKHANYYQIIHELVSKLESLFDGCTVYDIHSYNYKRWDRAVPLFNIGTQKIDTEKFGDEVDHWVNELGKISIPGVVSRAATNDVFFGNGYNLEYITTHFSKTLVLATEIKKVYCDELSGDAYPKIIRQLKQGLKTALLNNANFSSQKLEKWHYVSTIKLLDKTVDSSLLKLDKEIYNLLKSFELLAVVNPINTDSEKRKFFKSHYTQIPSFKYSPIKVNAFSLKQKLHSLSLQNIQDISIRYMYEMVVNSYFDKIDMIYTLNTNKFLYNSLRYFGRPSKKDLINASYILHLPDVPGEAKKEPMYDAKEAIEFFKDVLFNYGIEAKIELNRKVISQIMVLNSKKRILFKPDAKFKRKELQALAEHEIGVHMVTTMNSSNQKLKIFNLGLPVNTETQEGLAILSEYLSGNITLSRLKKIALRVIVVDLMCSGADFVDCFNILISDYDVEENDAFTIVTRIFRGGGFTKDYLYLSGFVKIFRMWEDNIDLTPLLVGKTSLPFYNTIEEMIGREMIDKPEFITKSILEPQWGKNNPIYSYIFSGLK
ncbi:MAG: flavohemoglobin expression-modulating QEGLA motif protein [Salinivirgaceae bacterium]|jgi:uncharacterized protein (TIGR02421 family)|nr:flavohemoglobin expression-modulating QEGLA motif protein [Salinivirgaceae bacterium]